MKNFLLHKFKCNILLVSPYYRIVTINIAMILISFDKPARLIIRILFGFASDSVFDKLNQSTNTEAEMLSYVRVSLPQVLSDFHLNTGKSSKVRYIFCFFVNENKKHL